MKTGRLYKKWVGGHQVALQRMGGGQDGESSAEESHEAVQTLMQEGECRSRKQVAEREMTKHVRF
jgi:hypothetical protein